MMGSGVPLLNEYKQEFFSKRFPQTVLGGLKLRLGYDAPVYVYINQVLLFLVPFLFGGLFTLLVELGAVADYVAVYVYGSLMTVFVLSAQIISLAVQRHQSVDLTFTKKKNLLADEDEVDFISCCDVETFKFVVTPKKYKLNILVHALVSGPMCGLVFWYLLPVTLNRLYYNNVGAVVVLYILGWVALCIGQYPLTTAAPPETATYRTTDLLELSAIMRPFYIYIFMMFDILNRYHGDGFLLTNQILHVFFIFLPVFWTLGILSPVDAFLLWLLEQGHVFLLGGSFMASDIRLCMMLALSLGVFLGVFYIPVGLGSVVLAACCGYVLSTDLGGLGAQFLRYCRTKNRVEASRVDVREDREPPTHRFMWGWGILEVVYHFCMLAAVGVLSGLLNYNSIYISQDVWYILGYCVIGVCVVEKILREIQGAYIIFGSWRNGLYPVSPSSRTFLDRKRRLKPLGFIRRSLVNWVGPFLILSYLSVTIRSTAPMQTSLREGLDSSTSVWYIFGVVRAFRWVWQSSVNSLFEVSIVHIVMVTLSSNATVLTLGVPILAMIVGICRDRLIQFLNKSFFVFTLLVSSWTDKKQRRGSTMLTIVLSVVLFPLVLAIILLSSAMSVPLLPFFTLPLFFISFPRPLRSWPEKVGASANSCPDTNFYKQLAPELSRAFSTSFSDGSLGEATPGNHYLVRFQDRLAWVMVLERGATYCTLSIKGLELQETSCHTAEALRIDDIFETAFEDAQGTMSIMGKPNRYLLHSLTPSDICKLKAYSDARNVLTGIIDNPSSPEMTMDAFMKSLVWVLLKYVNRLKVKEKIEGQKPKFDKEKSFLAQEKKGELKEMIGKSTNSKLKREIKKDGLPPLVPNFVTQEETSPHPPPIVSDKVKKMNSSWGSLDSFTDSIWSDEGDLKKPKALPKLPPVVPPSRKQQSPDIEDLFDELDMGLPAYDVSKPKPQPHQANSGGKFSKFATKGSYNNPIYTPQTNLAGSPDFKCPYSSHMSLPKPWRELPLDNSHVSRLLDKFPRDWYKHVIGCLDWSVTGQPSDQVIADVIKDDTLLNCYAQLTMACYSIFDNQGGYGGASYLYKCYMGDVPFNAMIDWLTENKDLHKLVKKAFRYGFKLMMDQMLLGEMADHRELQETLEEYDNQWYIGLETDPEWTEAILTNRNFLFSLGHSNAQNTYSSRTLSLQDMDVNIGRLNPEVVRGQWANLSLELLYLTNDDEERYSIQAHPGILRNLTVQAADPPLGYPIYSSSPLSVPLL